MQGGARPQLPPRVQRVTSNGVREVLVSLNPEAVARLDAYDFDRLRAAGVALPWTLEHSADGVPFVAAPAKRAPFQIVSVARLITGAGEGEMVSYADNDRTNLTRRNLRVRTAQRGGE